MMAAVRRPPSWMFRIAILNVVVISSANACHHVKFRQYRSHSCGDIAILRFSKRAAAAILDFRKFKFLPANMFERSNLRHYAKFHQDRPMRC